MLKVNQESSGGSNIIVLGPNGELAASEYVPRKSGKGGNTIIIVGSGHANGPPPLQQSSMQHQQSSSSNIQYSQPSLPSNYQGHNHQSDHHHLSASPSTIHYHDSLKQGFNDKNGPKFDDWNKKVVSGKLTVGSGCSLSNCGSSGSSIPQFMPIMVPYIRPKKVRTSTKKPQRAQESRRSQIKSQATQSSSLEPQIIIRKSKNSPPILIEEVKGPETESYIDFHVTSPNSISSSNHHGQPATISMVNGFQSQPMTATLPTITSLQQPATRTILSSDKNNESKQKKMLKNSVEVMRSPNIMNSNGLNAVKTESIVNPYQYIIPRTKINSPASISDVIPTITESNSDLSKNAQEIYDEKIFNEFYGFDQVPQIDLTSLPGEEHLSNILLSEGAGRESIGRNDFSSVFHEQNYIENNSDEHDEGLLSGVSNVRPDFSDEIMDRSLDNSPWRSSRFSSNFITNNGIRNKWQQEKRPKINPFNWWWAPWM